MTKRWVMMILAVLLISAPALVWASGQKEGGSGEVTVPENVDWVVTDRIGNPNAPMTLRYSVQLTYSHQTSIEARVDYLTKMSTEWAKRNTGVQLIPEVQSGSPDQILQKLLQQVASNTAPDFAQIDGMYVPLFYSSLTPLNDYISQDEIDDYFVWSRDTMVDPKDGKLKALWFTTNAVGLWYRKDVIANPPKTWDQWISTANRLQADGWADGMVLRGSRDEQINYGAVLPLFYGLDGKLVDDTGKPIFGEGQNRAKMIEVMSFWRRAVEQNLIPQRVIDIGADGDMAADASKPKQVSMILAGSWFYSQLKNTVKDDIDKWSFTFTPQKSADMHGQVAGGWNWGFFAKDPAKLKPAVDFIQTVYTSKEGMTGWCYTAGYTPTRSSILEEPPFSTDPWQLAFAKVVEVATTRPGVKAYPIITVNLQNAFQAVILGQETPEQAVDNAFRKTVSQLSS